MLKEKLRYCEIARWFEVSCDKRIKNWERIYLTEGSEDFAVERRGRGKKQTATYHENKGRYGYRRITMELRSRGIFLNHKTVWRLMKQMGLVCCVGTKKYRSYKGELVEYLDYYNNHRIKGKLKGLPPAIHRQ